MADFSKWKCILCIVLCICSISTFANRELYDGIDYFDVLNRKGGVASPLCPTDSNERKLSYIEYAEQCAMSLCGKPEEQKKFYITEDSYDENVSPEVMKKFAPFEAKLKGVVQKKMKEMRSLIDNLKERVTHKKGGGEISFINTYKDGRTFAWNEGHYQLFLESVYGRFVEVRIDPSKKMSERIAMNLKSAESMDKDFLVGLKLFAREKKQYIENNLHASIRQGYLTFDEARRKVALALDEFERTHREIEKSSHSAWKERYLKNNKDIVVKLRKDFEKVNDSSPERESLYPLENIAFEINTRLSGMFRDKNPLRRNRNPYRFDSFCNDQTCFKGIRSFLKKNLAKLVEQAEDKIDSTDFESLLVSACKSQIASASIRKYDTDKIKRVIPEVKRRLFDNVVKRYSAKSYDSFKNYLDKDVLFDTDNRTPAFSDPEKELEYLEHNLKSVYVASTSFNGSTESDLAYNLMYMYKRYNTFNPIDSMGFLCRNQRLLAGDHFVIKRFMNESGGEMGKPVSKDTVVLSEMTCMHHNLGAHVVAHELGHALSNAFHEGRLSSKSKGDYMRLRACATSLRKDKAPSPDGDKLIELLGFPGDINRTEEDTADRIASMVFPEDEEPTFCHMLVINGDFSRYIQLAAENDLEDRHSPVLLRLIGERIQKGMTLPRSCQKVLERDSDKYEVKRCAID